MSEGSIREEAGLGGVHLRERRVRAHQRYTEAKERRRKQVEEDSERLHCEEGTLARYHQAQAAFRERQQARLEEEAVERAARKAAERAARERVTLQKTSNNPNCTFISLGFLTSDASFQ